MLAQKADPDLANVQHPRSVLLGITRTALQENQIFLTTASLLARLQALQLL